ncbi:MAG: tRNA (5-methylaminomethyl-2-thiouridine)(34)-methyltransferase MnmD, partial [Burkholderiaceae bacterium]
MSGDADRLRPHPPLRFDDGAVWSPLFGDVFKSRDGAFAESRAVFVDGCELAARWRGRRAFTVLEIGFGLGVNFLSTLARWRDDPSRSERLVFVSIDKHPVDAADLRRALDTLGAAAVGPGAAEDFDALCEQWPPPLPGLHRLVFARRRVVLLLAFGDCGRMLPRLSLAADAVYLDGFAPARNPDAWTEQTMRAIARLCRSDARLSTYTAAAAVRRALHDAGFDVRRVAGFGGKRERIQAVRRPLPGAARRRAAEAEGAARPDPAPVANIDAASAVGTDPAVPAPPDADQDAGPTARDAIVVGAGL